MESQARYFLVGSVVSALIFATILFILWVSDVGGDKASRFYIVYFREQGLSGLQVDSQVTMKGIKVGSVSDFTIKPDDVERVKVLLKLEEGTPVKTDTRAVIKRNLLTGLATVELTNTSNSTPILEEIREGESFPVIPEGQTPLDQIANTVPSVINDAGEIVQRLRILLSDENVRNVSLTLENIRKFSEFLGENSQTFTEIALCTKTLAEDTQKLVVAWEKTGREMNVETTKVAQDLTTTLKQITQTAKTLDEETKVLSASWNQNSSRLVLEFTNLARDISVAAQSLSTTLEEFENPRSLVAGPAHDSLGPGESRKEKEGER